MVNADLINAGDFDKITSLCREAQFSLLGFEMVHIGVNADNEDAALKAANSFSAFFGFHNRIGNASIFSSDDIEIMKIPPFRGKSGHIGIGTNSVFRAMAFLERQGVEFNTESLRTDDRGNPRLIYLKEEIAGFAVHLVQKN